MKKIDLILLLFCFTMFVENTGCKKDRVSYSDSPGNSNDTPSLNRSPVTYAGEDQTIVVPPGYFFLYGSASDSDMNIENLDWGKISGPTDPVFEGKTSKDNITTFISTKISNLSAGTYVFELTATDAKGLYDKDTVSITIADLSSAANEIIFQNLSWDCAWGCSLSINNLYSYISVDTPFLVYIKRDSSSAWLQVGSGNQYVYGEKYLYDIGSNQLVVFDADNSKSDESDTPDLKIAF